MPPPTSARSKHSAALAPHPTQPHLLSARSGPRRVRAAAAAAADLIHQPADLHPGGHPNRLLTKEQMPMAKTTSSLPPRLSSLTNIVNKTFPPYKVRSSESPAINFTRDNNSLSNDSLHMPMVVRPPGTSNADMPQKLEVICQEPTIVFGEIEWSALDGCGDDDEDFNIVEALAEARAVRVVSAGRPTLVKLFKRGHSIDRTERLPLQRPSTPPRSAKRPMIRTPSHETLNSDLSADRKTFSTIDTLCQTPALSHDDDDCDSPISERSEDGPHTPSVHSIEDESVPTTTSEAPGALQRDISEPMSAASEGKLDQLDMHSDLSLSNPDDFKSRMRISRLRMFSRRSTTLSSPTPGAASAPTTPTSPLTSPSRLSLANNLGAMKSKLVARGAAERGSVTDLTADLATLDPKPVKQPRIRRIESRFGLNGRNRTS